MHKPDLSGAVRKRRIGTAIIFTRLVLLYHTCANGAGYKRRRHIAHYIAAGGSGKHLQPAAESREHGNARRAYKKKHNLAYRSPAAAEQRARHIHTKKGKVYRHGLNGNGKLRANRRKRREKGAVYHCFYGFIHLKASIR